MNTILLALVFIDIFMKCISLFMLLLSAKCCFAQEKPDTLMLNNTIDHYFLLDSLTSSSLSEKIKALQSKGYYFHQSELAKKDSVKTYRVDQGKRIAVVGVKTSSATIKRILNSKKDIYYVSPQKIKAFMQKITSVFDKKGQNFTKVQLKNHQLKNDTLLCDLDIEKSKKRYIDKTVVKGYKRFSKRFLKYYMTTKKPFSKELLKKTEKKINQLQFVKNKKQPAVLFTKDSTFLYLYLDRVKANRLDALLGFNNQEGENKIKFNGYVDISLINTLHKGETFTFKWNNTGQDQQQIDLEVKNPYTFNTPINLGYQLNIFRKDSTFVNTKHQISLGYKPDYKHLITTYYSNENSSVLKNSSNIATYSKNLFGATYHYLDLTTIGTPKFKVMVDASWGNKQTENEKTTQLSFTSDVVYVLEMNLRNHLYIQNRNAYLKSPNIKTNELYRIGGATTMRGFLEQSIVADVYNYTNVEYRYFTNAISYLYGFSDVGYFKNINTKNNLLSFGLGYTFGISSGLLKISYAVGKNQNTTFNLNNGLFHINFVTLF